MTEREKKYLSDMLWAIELIESFMVGIVSYEAYLADYKTKSAVERQLAIIGEAINKFMKESADNKLENAKQIINLRNRLVHSYDTIDDAIIWSILFRYLQPLKIEISTLFAQDLSK